MPAATYTASCVIGASVFARQMTKPIKVLADNTTYDALNRLQSVTEPTGKLSSYQYDAAGNRTMQRVQLIISV